MMKNTNSPVRLTLGMIFEYQPDMLKEYGSFAVQLMCDAFDELEDSKQSIIFLEIQRKSEHTLIRSAAWQQTAAMHLLTGDSEPAWAALHTARKISPDEPTLDTLELYMLLDEGKFDFARRRAETLQQQWCRQSRDQDMPALKPSIHLGQPGAVKRKCGFTGKKCATHRGVISWLK